MNNQESNMNPIRLLPRHAPLAYLLLGLWCSTIIAQAETRYWVGSSSE